MKLEKKELFSKLALSTLLLGSFVTSTYAETPPGKYCNTASACLDPMVTHAAVTTPNYLATQAAIETLQKGGNAVDAAISAASTLAVVYPQMNTIGGDNFWLIYNAKTKEVKALNASGRAGENVSIDFYKSKGYDKIPNRGYLSANTVPGIVSGWDEAYKYASKSMTNKGLPWKELFNKSILYASEGFAVTPSLARWQAINTDTKDSITRNLQRFDEFKHVYLKEDGSPYQVGEILKQPDLSKTLKLIANKGAKEFYEGSIAKAIVKDLKENGGVLTLNDFKQHTADWVDPLSIKYRQYTAYNLPPNTQGMASLEILNILNNFDLSSIPEDSADYYHLMTEATKEAFIDRDKYLTDPTFSPIPLDFLLSEQHGKDQSERIDMNKTAGKNPPLEPKGDTIWLGVIDKDGNAVSLIQSIYWDFGSAIVAKGTGVLLQNRGSFFSLNPNNINHLEPKKRTFHTLNAAMMLDKNNQPILIYGTMGGEGQPQTQAAIATRVIDYGMSVQDAVAAPRWLYGRTWGSESNSLKLEGRISQDVVQTLKDKGQPIEVLDEYTDTMGHAGAISINQDTGVISAATDPRSDGLAAGY
ncbi:gamma-glutamyltransferase [Aliarcobacter butzleri]|uniref:gamma-glutamyltransferase n=1 Tax=Aliarcobacter butzleri TaxID=28197 RepID=UPI00344B04FD